MNGIVIPVITSEQRFNIVWKHILHHVKFDESIMTPQIILKQQIIDAKSTWKSELVRNHDPKLLCHFETYSSLPQIFKEKHIYLFPVTPTKYIVVRRNIFYPLENIAVNSKFVAIDTNEKNLVSLLNSSNSIIDRIYTSGVFQSIWGESMLNYPCIGSIFGSFDLNIENLSTVTKISTNSSECLIEALNSIHIIYYSDVPRTDVNSSLYYLYYRCVYERMIKVMNCDDNNGTHKSIYVDMVSPCGNEDGIYHIYTFTWRDVEDISSIKCINHSVYEEFF